MSPLYVWFAEIWKLGQIVGVRTNAVAGDLAIGDQVQLNVDHVVLQATSIQETSGARVVKRENVGQQDIGNTLCLRGRVAAKRLELRGKQLQKRIPILRPRGALHGGQRDVEQVFVAAVVEDRVDGRTTHLVRLCQVVGLHGHWHQRAGPDPDVRIGAQKLVGNVDRKSVV